MIKIFDSSLHKLLSPKPNESTDINTTNAIEEQIIKKFGPNIRGFGCKIVENKNGVYFNHNNHIYRANGFEIISTDNEYNNQTIPKLKTYRFDIQKSGNIVASANEYYVNSIVVFDADLKFLYKKEDNNKSVKDIYADEGFIALKSNKEKRDLNSSSHIIVIYDTNGDIIKSLNYDTLQIADIWIASYQPYLKVVNPRLIILENKEKILIPLLENVYSTSGAPYKKIIHG